MQNYHIRCDPSRSAQMIRRLSKIKSCFRDFLGGGFRPKTPKRLFYKHLCNSIIHSVSRSSFSSNSSKRLHSKTVKARELKFWEKFYLPPHVTCHKSYVMCHMSPVTCHVLCVCVFVCVFFGITWFICILLLLSVGATHCRVSYQRGLTRLVLTDFVHLQLELGFNCGSNQN